MMMLMSSATTTAIHIWPWILVIWIPTANPNDSILRIRASLWKSKEKDAVVSLAQSFGTYPSPHHHHGDEKN